MARPSTGEVKERKTKAGCVFALRFTAYGTRRYVTLGADGWDRKKAEAELRRVLAEVELGIWKPPSKSEPEATREVPTFHEFASEWLTNRTPELRDKSIASYRWQLSGHLLPAFARTRLDEIKPEDVDRFKAEKLREGKLGPNQINKCLGTLARILKAARRYGYIAANPLDDVDRLRGAKPRRPTIEPEQLHSLLEAAGPLRPILATLAGAGLRDGEACALDLSDVILATGTVNVRESKTEAGIRQVDLPAALREALTEHKAEIHRDEGPMFLTRPRNGEISRQSVSNLGRRFKTVIKRANVRLAKLGIEPISEAATPYSLRRLYATLRYAHGDHPIKVAEQMGHSDAGHLSMSVYAKALGRRERLQGATLREFDWAFQWSEMGGFGTSAETTANASQSEATTPEAAIQGFKP